MTSHIVSTLPRLKLITLRYQCTVSNVLSSTASTICTASHLCHHLCAVPDGLGLPGNYGNRNICVVDYIMADTTQDRPP